MVGPRGGLVLVLAESDHELASCLEDLSHPAADCVLRVSFAGNRNHVADDWAAAFGEKPRRALEVVSNRGAVPAPDDDAHGVAQVQPGDLTGLGVRLSGVLEQCVVDGIESCLCFDSLTVVLQYAKGRIVFQFLHTLGGLIQEAGTRAHFHLDPGAVDDRDVASLTTLFDVVVTVGAEGDVSVQSR